ncbi:AMP-binding protein [Aliidongia dinghuensis]|uniref:AMP-binding protein n=1 Tax=Aliidongia dinghuensis TaxID=1867774 RepID=A0A8J2YZP1_9PROT|nr:class I adenylate-forming enzyme family protein [Aliidongia dinghuensis]GGF43034.1 AMP-binding protein [Aliidongia dinghuensis]
MPAESRAATKRARIAGAAIPSVAERRRTIEAEALPRNMAALISEASRAYGDRLVWDFFEGGEMLTYRDLEPRVHALADGLRSVGVRRGSHVAVMMPNKAAMPLSWLAIATIGAVMVPVNNTYSEREIVYVLTDSETEFLIVDESCLAPVESVLARGELRLDRGKIIVSGESGHSYLDLEQLMRIEPHTPFIDEAVGHDDLLNIQYTSGTTGFPKGCMLSQRYWISAGKVNAFRDGRHYRHILASTPFYYMDPQWLLLMSLYQHATLHVAKRQSASRFMEWVREREIEFCLLPVLTLKQPPHPDDRQNALIRSNVYGVSKLTHGALEERFDVCAREAFGMTEIGPTLFMPIEATDMVGSGSCGVPCPFREVRVADDQGNSLPPGEIGELLVRGPGILKGYYNRPDATRDAFHGDWFRTGDLFRMDDRGFLYIVGRIKDSIRRSGENIAAREVESVLNSFDGVVEAVAVPVPDEARGQEIKAMIVWVDAVFGEPDLTALIAHCQRNLAPFKVPRYFQFVPELPKTSSGKIAKHQLVSGSTAASARVYDRASGAVIATTGAPHA